MEDIKIAHLSDLHCNSTKNWEDGFQSICNTLSERHCRPRIIFITGDLVDEPTEKNYTTIVTSLRALAAKIEEHAERPYIIPVPGNHDYFTHGNKFTNYVWPPSRRIWGPISRPWYNNGKTMYWESLKKLIEPYQTFDEILLEIFAKHKIAIFPLDSNNFQAQNGVFAEGRVDKPHLEIKRLHDKYVNMLANSAEKNTIAGWLKIAALHHHPLPIASNNFDEKIEPGLLLRNPYQLLYAAQDAEINFILHGHRHKSGTTSIKNLDLRSNAQHMSVIGCGTSLKVDRNKEFKLITLKSDGQCILSTYVAPTSTGSFEKKEEAIKLIDYGVHRKELYFQTKRAPSDRLIISAKNKRKVVTIEENGNADIHMKVESIAWDTEAAPPKEFSETFYADTGRIVEGYYDFGACPLLSHNNPLSWINPKLGQADYPKPDEGEKIEIKFHPDVPFTECCKYAYKLFNGYALTDSEHKICYNWPYDETIRKRKEIAIIESDFPVDAYELVIKFPGKNFFPHPHSFKIRAYPKVDTSSAMSLLLDEPASDTVEENFLEGTGAKKIFEEFNEAHLYIRYPKPNYIYLLSWTVPEEHREPGLDADHKREVQRLRAAFGSSETHGGDAVTSFYESVSEEISEFFADKELNFFLLGYNETKNKLEVTRHPKGIRVRSGLFVGRGPAGQAYKTRRTQYWSLKSSRRNTAEGIFSHHIQNSLENVVDGVEPIAVISLPLTYPQLTDPDLWMDMTRSLQKPEDAICPAFGVLSIISSVESLHESRLRADQDNTDEDSSKPYLHEMVEAPLGDRGILTEPIYEIIGLQLLNSFDCGECKE